MIKAIEEQIEAFEVDQKIVENPIMFHMVKESLWRGKSMPYSARPRAVEQFFLNLKSCLKSEVK